RSPGRAHRRQWRHGKPSGESATTMAWSGAPLAAARRAVAATSVARGTIRDVEFFTTKSYGVSATSHRRNSGTKFRLLGGLSPPTLAKLDIRDLIFDLEEICLDPRNPRLRVSTMSGIRVLAGTRKGAFILI